MPSFQRQAKRQKRLCGRCYAFTPHEHPERLGNIPSKPIVFVCGDADIAFARPDFVRQIMAAIRDRRGRGGRTFYLQSKRPSCLQPFLAELPPSVALVCTLETNRDGGYDKISKAPPPSQRFAEFVALDHPRKIVTVEPVMDFGVDEFADWIERIRPELVYLGFNSHPRQVPLPEPTAEKLAAFAAKLVRGGIRIVGKDLRGIPLPGVERYQD
jgi:hypothetical protein